jgi:hypothetical protein
MDQLTPPDARHAPTSPDEEDNDLWSETLSGLGLIGAVVLIVLVISLVGRM